MREKWHRWQTITADDPSEINESCIWKAAKCRRIPGRFEAPGRRISITLIFNHRDDMKKAKLKGTLTGKNNCASWVTLVIIRTLLSTRMTL